MNGNGSLLPHSHLIVCLPSSPLLLFLVCLLTFHFSSPLFSYFSSSTTSSNSSLVSNYLLSPTVKMEAPYLPFRNLQVWCSWTGCLHDDIEVTVTVDVSLQLCPEWLSLSDGANYVFNTLRSGAPREPNLRCWTREIMLPLA